MLPAVVKEPLAEHLKQVRRLHQQDLRQGRGRIYLPDALARKYPNADRDWSWQYVFPALKYFSGSPLWWKCGAFVTCHEPLGTSH
jgi:hypothetical protein